MDLMDGHRDRRLGSGHPCLDSLLVCCSGGSYYARLTTTFSSKEARDRKRDTVDVPYLPHSIRFLPDIDRILRTCNQIENQHHPQRQDSEKQWTEFQPIYTFPNHGSKRLTSLRVMEMSMRRMLSGGSSSRPPRSQALGLVLT
jgi:hypothetical protein